jgi:hypothetical protein
MIRPLLAFPPVTDPTAPFPEPPLHIEEDPFTLSKYASGSSGRNDGRRRRKGYLAMISSICRRGIIPTVVILIKKNIQLRKVIKDLYAT